MGNSHSNLEYREPASKNRTINRLRRSIRASFHKRKREGNKWQDDEIAVRNGTCSFSVKYLGCVQVFEARGMQVCEDALEELRKSRKHPVRAIIHVSGDGIRVVEEETKGLVVDQTIEKVSFCAPDRNHERGFSYICRDGATRRWMCYGFHSVADSGERLSHAVGCAFAVCLEKKVNRDKETVVTSNLDSSAFVRTGSFKQTTLTEKLHDPQRCKSVEPPPIKPVQNPHAIERPHATTSMLQRQASCRRLGKLDKASPFKRQLSLRLSDLPSTQARQQAMRFDVIENIPQPIIELSPMSEYPDDKSGSEMQFYQNNMLPASKSLGKTNNGFVTSSNVKEDIVGVGQMPNGNSQSNLVISAQKEKSRTLFELALKAQSAKNYETPGEFDKKWTALENTTDTVKTFEVQL